MANTVPPVDNPEILRSVQEKGERTGIHVLSACNVTKGMAGRELVDMEALEQAGAAAFTDDGKPLMDEALLKEAMERDAAFLKAWVNTAMLTAKKEMAEKDYNKEVDARPKYTMPFYTNNPQRGSGNPQTDALMWLIK